MVWSEKNMRGSHTAVLRICPMLVTNNDYVPHLDLVQAFNVFGTHLVTSSTVMAAGQ